MTDLDRQLHQLAERIDPPATPFEADLARGRRRVRRTRALASGAVAVVVAGGLGVVVGRDDGSARTAYVADPTPTPSATAVPTPAPTPTDRPERPGVHLTRSEQRILLGAYQRALSELLDPAGEHLAPWDMTNGVQGSGARGRTLGLGTKLSWTNAGEAGLGMLQVFVSVDWDSQFNWFCDGGCRDVAPPPGAVSAQVHEADGILEVAVEHADGQVVVLSPDPLFGNNSSVPVSSLDLTEQQLLRAAADPRLVLSPLAIVETPS